VVSSPGPGFGGTFSLHPYRRPSSSRRQAAIAAAWQHRAAPLADWALDNLIVRTDRYGGQVILADGSIGRTTSWGLTRDRLVQHFEAGTDASAEDIIGVHVAEPDHETCRWVAFDIDKHGDEDADANLRFALRLHRRARKAGLAVVLTDSSGGRGGYHIWALVDRPIPMADARRLVLWLVRGWERAGLPKSPDLFPANDHLTGLRCGTWLRLPGRHHKRPAWSRVWSSTRKTWLEGEAAIDALLALRGEPVDVAAIVPEDFGRPPPPRERPACAPGRQYDDGDEDRDLALARDALRFYPDDDLHYDDWLEVLMALRQLDEPGRELCHEWSERSGKYDPVDLDRRWDSLQVGDEALLGTGRLVRIATLFRRALDAGWPGPAVHGLHYPVDFRERRGPVFIVKGLAAYRAFDVSGGMAVGLPDRDQPCLKKVARLLDDDTREIVVVGTRRPLLDPEEVACVLDRMLGRSVKAIRTPAPYEDVPTWLGMRDETHDTKDGE
jgi:hypothetical protein